MRALCTTLLAILVTLFIISDADAITYIRLKNGEVLEWFNFVEKFGMYCNNAAGSYKCIKKDEVASIDNNKIEFGKIIKVENCDAILIQVNNKNIYHQLDGIKCLDERMNGYQEGIDLLRSYVNNQVKIEVFEVDGYNVFAVLTTENGTNLNDHILQKGYAFKVPSQIEVRNALYESLRTQTAASVNRLKQQELAKDWSACYSSPIFASGNCFDSVQKEHNVQIMDIDKYNKTLNKVVKDNYQTILLNNQMNQMNQKLDSIDRKVHYGF